jgi:proline iminopeptidase
MRVTCLAILATSFGAVACAESKPADKDSAGAVQQATAVLPAGETMLPVADGRIWYKKSGTGTRTPVILVHGGPGFNSFYLKSLEALGDDRPVIRYDQLGAGKSAKISDTTLFTIAHFVRELDSLRAALGYDKIHVLGHSWGTIIAYEYYRAHPEHVTSLTLAGACLDIPAYAKHAQSLVATLSDSAQKAIKIAESTKKFDAPSYQNAINEFYGKYVFLHPVEPDLDSTLKMMNEGIYGYLQGPSEFTITGTLKNYNVKPQLATIKVPTLYTVGEFDEVGPDVVRGFAAATPGSKFELIPAAAHITTWDNPRVMTRVVRDFLRAADSPKAVK